MQRYKKIFKEDFSNKVMKGVIKNVVSILQKRLGVKFYPGKYPVFVYKRGEGNVQGLMLYAGLKAIRLNWLIGKTSSSVVSVDFWNDPNPQPDLTIKTEGQNIVQLLDLITTTFQTGKPSEIDLIQEAGVKRGQAIEWIKYWIKTSGTKLKAIAGMKMQYIYQEFQKWSLDNIGGWSSSAVSPQTFRNNMLLVFRDNGVDYKFAQKIKAEKAPKEVRLVNKKEEKTFSDEIKDAWKLSPDEMFEQIEVYAKDVVTGRKRGLIITGDPGIGKSWTIYEGPDSILKKSGAKFKSIGPGKITPMELYKFLYDNNGQILVLDDIDSVFFDESGANIMKGAMGSGSQRMISYFSRTTGPEKDYPSEFEFTGRVIIISNAYASDFAPAIRSRAELIELNLTQEEIVERIRGLADKLPPTDADYEDKMRALDFLLTITNEYKKLDFRTFSSCVDDVSSGNPNWKAWVVRKIRLKQSMK